MTREQLRALADARAEPRRGLIGHGQSWSTERPSATPHSAITVRSLVDRGLLRLWARGTVAHITELGETALQTELEPEAGRE